MDENIVRILASYGCKYMADDNKEMIEEIEAYVKKREQQLHIPVVVSSACCDYQEGINMQCAKCDEPKYKHKF